MHCKILRGKPKRGLFSLLLMILLPTLLFAQQKVTGVVTGYDSVPMPEAPKEVQVNGSDVLNKANWDSKSKTYLLAFDNDPDGVEVHITW